MLNLSVYYRLYAEDGSIPSKTPAAPGDPFLGRIKARLVPPPHTAKAVKRCIAKMENIKDRTSTTLFLTPYSQSPMADDDKVTILSRIGPGSTPQEPLALVAKLSDSERSDLESEGRGGLANAAEPDAGIQYRKSIQHSPTFLFVTSQLLREVYYLLYADDCGAPSKVAIDPEDPPLGRIRADSVAPPRSLDSIKRCISRVERNPGLAHANIFANLSCVAPLKEGRISILGTDGPGLSPDEAMAIVVESPPIPDGRYHIKNRAGDIFWNAWNVPIKTVRFWCTTMKKATRQDYNHTQVNDHSPIIKFLKNNFLSKWDITHDSSGNIFMTSPCAPSSWVGVDVTGSTLPVPWRLIPADDKFY